jgi:hypothetical protein
MIEECLWDGCALINIALDIKEIVLEKARSLLPPEKQHLIVGECFEVGDGEHSRIPYRSDYRVLFINPKFENDPILDRGLK